MENNIPTLYIFELDSFVVKSAKFQLFYALLNRVAMIRMTQAK